MSQSLEDLLIFLVMCAIAAAFMWLIIRTYL